MHTATELINTLKISLKPKYLENLNPTHYLYVFYIHCVCHGCKHIAGTQTVTHPYTHTHLTNKQSQPVHLTQNTKPYMLCPCMTLYHRPLKTPPPPTTYWVKYRLLQCTLGQRWSLRQGSDMIKSKHVSPHLFLSLLPPLPSLSYRR